MINEITTTFLHCQSLPIIHLILGIFFSFLSCSFSFIQVSNGHAAHQLCGILQSLCQQLWCLVCWVTVYLWFAYRSLRVFFHSHLLAFFLLCVYTIRLQMKIVIFCKSIGNTAFMWAFYIQQPDSRLFLLFLHTVYVGMKHSVF